MSHREHRRTLSVRRGSTAFGIACALLASSIPSLGGRTAKQPDPIGRPYQRLIERTAERHRLDPLLLEALVEVESGRNAGAVSPKGARGLGQLMPGTARRFDVSDPHDPEDNLDGAARYLAWLIERYQGDLTLALAAYNAGEGAVDRYVGVPPYPETKSYVRKVLSRAGLRGGGRREGRSDPVRLVRGADGAIVVTNTR